MVEGVEELLGGDKGRGRERQVTTPRRADTDYSMVTCGVQDEIPSPPHRLTPGVQHGGLGPLTTPSDWAEELLDRGGGIPHRAFRFQRNSP